MNFLLDTHVFLWALGDPDRLGNTTRQTLADPENQVFVSVVALWEIAVKRRVGKLQADVADLLAQMAPASKLQLLGLLPRHILALDELPFHEQHRDPFDHLVVAQAISESMTLVTSDRNVGLYPVRIMAA